MKKSEVTFDARNLLEGMNRIQAISNKIENQNNVSVEYILEVLSKNGIDLSAEQILNDYEKVNSVETLDRAYYQKYKQQFRKGIKHDPLGLVDEDIFLPLIKNVLKENRDLAQVGDVSFIDDILMECERKKLKNVRQEDIELVIDMLIRHSELHDVHRLEEIKDCFYDYNVMLMDYVKVCHNRNLAFKERMKQLYRCYEDADPKICPSVYREMKK